MIGNGNDGRCELCRFFHLNKAMSADGQCRIRAPNAYFVGTKEIKSPNGQVMGLEPVYGSTWPGVAKDRWCGEFQQKVTIQ